MRFTAELLLWRPEQELHERLLTLVVQEVGHPCSSETKSARLKPKYTLAKPQVSANIKISLFCKPQNGVLLSLNYL